MDLGRGGPARWLVGMAISLLVFGGCTPRSTDERPPADGHQVPDIVGLTVSEACESLSREGFGIKIFRDIEGMSHVCAGPAAVTNQSPAPGTILEEGARVTVHVSPAKTLPDG